MKILLDFIPLVLFFIAYKFGGIFVATAVLMIATLIQMGLILLLDKKLAPMHLTTLALIMVFGCLTLVLHDERFVKWKPTVIYAVIALALAGAKWIWHKNFLKMFLGSQLNLPNKAWTELCVAWILYAIFMAALNGFVVVLFSTDTWAFFKLWGYVFPVIFILGQIVYLAKRYPDLLEGKQ